MKTGHTYPSIPINIPDMRADLSSLESIISAHWLDFRDTFDIPDHLLTMDINLSFTSGWAIIEWVKLPEEVQDFRVVPWPDFLPWYVSHTTDYDHS